MKYAELKADNERLRTQLAAVLQAIEDLPSWLIRLADDMEKHKQTEALFMQEITGLRNWAALLQHVKG